MPTILIFCIFFVKKLVLTFFFKGELIIIIILYNYHNIQPSLITSLESVLTRLIHLLQYLHFVRSFKTLWLTNIGILKTILPFFQERNCQQKNRGSKQKRKRLNNPSRDCGSHFFIVFCIWVGRKGAGILGLKSYQKLLLCSTKTNLNTDSDSSIL